jgi:transposase, IS5 family
MPGQLGFFDRDERYASLSAAGDPLERLAMVIDFELFRPELEAALERSDRARGGRPPYDAVLMFKVLVLQALYTLSDEQTEYQIRDRLSFMRFVGLALEDRVPDAKTVWLFREQLTRAGAIGRLFARFDAALRDAGYLAMGGQIVDATIIQARRPRLTRGEKAMIKGGGIPETWSQAKRAQIDTDGRWTIKRGRKRAADRSELQERTETALVIPVFGHKNHLGIDRQHGFIRSFAVTDAARHDCRQLGRLLDQHNTASAVWADSAYRSAAIVALLARRGLVPQFQRPSRAASRCRRARPRQLQPGAGAGRDRARLRRPKVPPWPGHPLGRPGPRHGQARPRQPGHQHAPPGLVRDPSGAGLRAGGAVAGPA